MARSTRSPPGQWAHGLFDSPLDTSMGTACCCPCIVFGKTADRERDPSGKSHETYNRDCFMYSCIGCFYATGKRTEMREKYNIEGSSMSDCCVSCWCPCYAVVQQDNEVVSRQRGGKNVNTAGYQSQQGMEMNAR